MRRGDLGAALLEVLVALTVFATAGATVVSLLAELTRHESRAEALERRLSDEERLLTAISLLSARDLDRRLGRRTEGPYAVEIQRPARGLYRVTVAIIDGGDAQRPDLAALLYRPEEEDAEAW